MNDNEIKALREKRQAERLVKANKEAERKNRKPLRPVKPKLLDPQSIDFKGLL